MSTKLAPSPSGVSTGMHTAGIFADMTVDGPEIGTLVLIVDRGRNMPNRKTIGKQSAYCAARLGKEAKKTETDKRGGQTPKWDQELRFTVHDSPDYNTLKVSVFSEDKRTDLVGEAWVNLTDVIVPGGGKNDLWQGLNCKGKYAGEVRIELTYYDARPKPERTRGESMGGSVMGGEDEGIGRSQPGSRVRRRPLPGNPNAAGGSMTPDMIPEGIVPIVPMPGRAKHGPRDLGAPSRANSMPPEMPSTQHAARELPAPIPTQPLRNMSFAQPESAAYEPAALVSHQQRSRNVSPAPYEQPPPEQYYPEPEYHHEQPLYDEPQQQPHYEEPPQQHDFLPQLPPSNRARGGTSHSSRASSRQAHPAPTPVAYAVPASAYNRPHLQNGLTHSHSAPNIHPQSVAQRFDHGHGLRTDFPEPLQDVEYQHQQLRQRRNDVPPNRQDEYGEPYLQQNQQQYNDNAEEDDGAPPPPPPMHSISAPAVPRLSHAQSQQSPPATRFGGTPPSARHQSIPSASPSPSHNHERNMYAQQTPPHGHPARGRSIDSYAPSPEYGNNTPSSLLPGGSSPSPHSRSSAGRNLPHRHSVAEAYSPLPPQQRPHPLSQEVSRPRSRSPLPHSYSEPPLQAYGQAQHYLHDPRSRNETPPMIKPRALSPQPPMMPQLETMRSKSAYSLQYPVRAFESSDNSPLSTSQPRSPIPRKSVSPMPSPPATSNGDNGGMPFGPDSFDALNPSRPTEAKGPIVGWHGQVIDPSDHLPVDSWAPEPEAKVPSKTYGLGRDREFGPRDGARLSNDVVVKMRMKGSSSPRGFEGSQAGSRHGSTKNMSTPTSRSPMSELHEHHNYNNPAPNQYAPQQQDYGRDYRDTSPGGYDAPSPSHYGYGAPSVPPKVPLQRNEYGGDALAREISSIDIGGGGRHSRRGSAVPSPGAYVPSRRGPGGGGASYY